jgi:WD40 repeat protein
MADVPLSDVYVAIVMLLKQQNVPVDSLVTELESRNLFPVRSLWTGGEMSGRWNELEQRYQNVPSDVLVQLLQKHQPPLAPGESLLTSVLPEARVEPPCLAMELWQQTQLGQVGRKKRFLQCQEELQLCRLQETFSCRGHTHHVFSVKLHPHGGVVTTSADDGLVKIWSTTTGKLLHTLRGFSNVVVDLSFSPDGRFLAAAGAGEGNGVLVYEHPTYQRSGRLLLDGGRAAATVLSYLEDVEGKETFLGVGTSRNGLEIYQYVTAKNHWELVESIDMGVTIWTLSNRKDYFSVGLETGFRVYQMVKAGASTLCSEFANLPYAIMTLEWAPDSVMLFAAPSQGSPMLLAPLEAADRTEFGFLIRDPNRRRLRNVIDAKFSCFGQFLFVLLGAGENDCTVSVLRTIDMTLIRIIEVHADPCFVLDRHPRLEHVFMTSGYDGLTKIFDGVSGKLLRHFSSNSAVFAGQFSSTGDGVAVSTENGCVSYYSHASLGGGVVPKAQFFASDYDNVLIQDNGEFLDAQSGLSLAAHAAGDVVVDFEGIPLEGRLRIPLEGHVSAMERLRRFQANQRADVPPLPPVMDILHEHVVQLDEPELDFSDEQDYEHGGEDDEDDDDDDDEDVLDLDDEDEEEYLEQERRRKRGRSYRERYEFSDEENDEEEEDEFEELTPRREPSKRTKSLTNFAEFSDEDNNDDIGGDEEQPPQYKPPRLLVSEWMKSDCQSRERTWYVPQVGDVVVVFYEGLVEYYRLFHPEEALPPPEISGNVFQVVECGYARNGVTPYCNVRLKNVEFPEVTIRYATFIDGVVDFVVLESEVNRGRQCVEMGALVKVFFADEQSWYTAKVVELRGDLPLGWLSVRVQWSESAEDDPGQWISPWELFPAAEEILPELPHLLNLYGFFNLMVELFRKESHHSLVQRALNFDVGKFLRFQEGLLVYPMPGLLLLKRLRRRYYRSIASLKQDLGLFYQSMKWLHNKTTPCPEADALFEAMLTLLTNDVELTQKEMQDETDPFIVPSATVEEQLKFVVVEKEKEKEKEEEEEDEELFEMAEEDEDENFREEDEEEDEEMREDQPRRTLRLTRRKEKKQEEQQTRRSGRKQRKVKLE